MTYPHPALPALMEQIHVEFSNQTRAECRHLIELALVEDLGSSRRDAQRDITSCSVVPESARGVARFVARKPGIICGVAVCHLVPDVAQVDLHVDVRVNDGQWVDAGQSIASLSGLARDILLVERTCLNFLGRLSGISTLTRQFVDCVRGTRARVLDTRKTTPGWRSLEKYAVACGGGFNHRRGLYDAVLIKDNHLAMIGLLTDQPLGEIDRAVASARQWIAANADRLPDGDRTVVEIEVDRLDQFESAIKSRPDIILLDNMSPDEMVTAVAMRDRRFPDVKLEASGGVSLESIAKIASTGVDRISVGALTHSAVNLDIGLDWQTG